MKTGLDTFSQSPCLRINTLRVRVKTEYEQVKPVQDKISQCCQDRIQHQLESSFFGSLKAGRLSQCITPPIRLDLGNIPYTEFDTVFTQRLIERLLEWLSQKGFIRSPLALKADTNNKMTATESTMDEHTVKGPEAPELSSSSLIQVVREYLNTGQAPEELRLSRPLEDWLPQAWEKEPGPWAEALAICCLQRQPCRRLIEWLPPDLWSRLIQLWCPDKERLSKKISVTLKRQYSSLSALLYLLKQCPEHAISQKVREGGLVRTFEWLDKILTGYLTAHRRLLDAGGRPSEEDKRQLAEVAASLNIDGARQQHHRNTHSQTIRVATAMAQKILLKLEDQLQLPANHRPLEQSQSTDIPGQKDSPRVKVDNAGLILLWPFLPSLLTQLGCLTDQEFVDEHARLRAITALGWIVVEQAPMSEESLPLLQVLTHSPFFPLASPLPALLPEEQEVCQGWFSGIIQQVPGLDRCTIQDVRTLFLQREGLLYAYAQHWHLDVDSAFSDLMLKDVSWPMNDFQYPWMDNPCVIHWLDEPYRG